MTWNIWISKPVNASVTPGLWTIWPLCCGSYQAVQDAICLLEVLFIYLCFNIFNRYFVSSFWNSHIFCPGEFLVCPTDFSCLFYFINLTLDNPCLCCVADIKCFQLLNNSLRYKHHPMFCCRIQAIIRLLSPVFEESATEKCEFMFIWMRFFGRKNALQSRNNILVIA